MKNNGSQRDTMRAVVLYHGHCNDGFGAAWAAWKYYRGAARYQPVRYGDDPPSLSGHEEVFILDFSYPRPVVEKMATQNQRVIVIDHHQSAMKALAGLENTFFNLEKSAAVLAWEYFFPKVKPPPLLLYIQDYDLWQFALPNSKEVAIALSSYPMDFSTWDRLDPGELAQDGRPLARLRRELVKMICNEAKLVRFDGHEVPVVNTSVYGSEVGEELLRRHSSAPFSLSYYDRAHQRHWSLRSRSDFDVSAVARRYGGGGHRQAAGFETPLPDDHFLPASFQRRGKKGSIKE